MHFDEPKTTILKKKMARDLSSSFLDQMRCRKSSRAPALVALALPIKKLSCPALPTATHTPTPTKKRSPFQVPLYHTPRLGCFAPNRPTSNVISRLPRRAIASNFVSPDLCATNMADFFYDDDDD
jgi:hypothetical protein